MTEKPTYEDLEQKYFDSLAEINRLRDELFELSLDADEVTDLRKANEELESELSTAEEEITYLEQRIEFMEEKDNGY